MFIYSHYLSVSSFLMGLYLCSALVSCEQKKPYIEKSFYHWKTQFECNAAEKKALDSLGVEKLYVHFFDIDWDESRNMPVPLAQIQWKDSLFPVKKIVPTVFITNRTFEQLSEKDVPNFAQKIISKIEQHLQTISIGASEIQIDCDWTESTRAIYFSFLSEIKKQSKNIPISATIRLHQVKYFRKTGIPPVNRGMLMCYNLGDVRNKETQNSILDISDLKKYISPSIKYPLPLDIALPIFEWGVVRRNEKTVHLLNDFELNTTNRHFFTEISPTLFSCDSSHYEKGVYLYKDDQIRIEKVSDEDLQNAYILLKPFLTDSSTLVFYHLSYISRRFAQINADFRR